MVEPITVDVITIFPDMLRGFLDESMLKLAAERGAVRVRLINLRNFTHDAHRTTDDRPYGGGPGMVMKPEPLFEAVEAVRTPRARVVLMSPQGGRSARPWRGSWRGSATWCSCADITRASTSVCAKGW